MSINLLGIHLSLWLGQTVPQPAPLTLIEALQSAEVTIGDTGPSAFQLTFHVGRMTPLDLPDYRVLTNPLLKPFNRVLLLIRFAVAPQVLLDGIITNQTLSPSNEPGASTLTLTGEDVSVMMDLEQKHREFPAHPDFASVTEIIKDYAAYGLNAEAMPTPVIPDPQERVPQQAVNYTDRQYIQELARLYGFVFYVEAGPAPKVNTAYWGPPKRLGLPQRALSVNMGPNTNVESINFRYNGLAPEKVIFHSGDSDQTIDSPSTTRVALVSNRAELKRTTYLSETDDLHIKERAQGMVDHSLDEVVTATGELDTMRYNDFLKPRQLVGVRGVGKTYDGNYYVKSVTHQIQKGQYKQSFTLTREGTGTRLSLVRP